MLSLDWADIAIHAAVAVVVLANGTFWIKREINQHKDNPWRIFTSPQSLLEWFIPSVIIPMAMYFAAVKLGVL